MKLSDSFKKAEQDYKLELEVLVLNINPGYNEELMRNCKTLGDYMTYVDTVRTYKKEYSLEEAVERAIKECMDSDVLADFLRANQREAKHVSIYEYDEEKHAKQLLEEGRQEGLKLGLERGREQGQEELAKLIQILLKDNLQEDLIQITEDKEYREQLYRKYNLIKDVSC